LLRVYFNYYICKTNASKSKQNKAKMKSLNQQKAIFYRNNLVSFIDWNSEHTVETLAGVETRILIYIGTALLNVNIIELTN